MPAFAGPALDLTYHIYEVAAAVIHRGPSPTAGHYVTALFASEGTWLADDGVQPNPAPNIPDLSRSSYLIFLRRSH
jgi:ubiquitin C-terminal hydrolase